MDWETWKRMKAYANDNGSTQKPPPDDSWTAGEKLISDSELKRVKDVVREQKELILRKNTAILKKDVIVAEKEVKDLQKGNEPITTVPLNAPATQASIGEEMERISNIKDPEMRKAALVEFRAGNMIAAGADPNVVMLIQAKNDNGQPIQAVALQGAKQESDVDMMMKWWSFFEKVEEKAAKKYAPVQTSTASAPDDTLLTIAKTAITKNFGAYLDKKFSGETPVVVKSEDPSLINSTIGPDGMFKVSAEGVSLKLTPAQYIDFQKSASDIRIAELKATNEIGKSDRFNTMLGKFVGPIGDAVAEVARGAGEGIQIDSTRQVAGKNIVKGWCPDCLKANPPVKTPLIVENPEENGQYECPKTKDNHPNVKYVVWHSGGISK